MKYVIGFCFFTAFNLAMADTKYSVCQIGVENDDDVYLLPCEEHTSQQGCTNGNWIHWTLNTLAGKGMLANAQAALVSDNDVIVRLQGCSNGFDHAFMVRLVKR